MDMEDNSKEISMTCFCESPKCIYYKDGHCDKMNKRVIGTSVCSSAEFASDSCEKTARNFNGK